MTSKSEDDGLAEIKRLLKSLDQTTAGERPPPPSVPLTRDRAPEPTPFSARPSAQEPLKVVPPSTPPAVRSMESSATPLPTLAIALVSILAAVGGVSLWLMQPGLLTAQRASPGVDVVDRVASASSTSPVATASLPPTPQKPASGGGGRDGGVVAADRAASPPAPPTRIAQAVRSQSAVTETPQPTPVPPAEPKLRVPGRIIGVAGAAVPVPIEVDGTLASASAVVVIQGLPAGARPSKGALRPSGDWSLSASDAAGLSVDVPVAASGRHALTIELRAIDAIVLASIKSTLELASPPSRAPMADAVRPPETTAIEWLTEAKRLINAGHIGSSRLVLERAADAGLGEAARLLGDTFDPAKLYVMGVRGMSGDIQKAIFWYERADELGDPQAKARLLALGAR